MPKISKPPNTDLTKLARRIEGRKAATREAEELTDLVLSTGKQLQDEYGPTAVGEYLDRIKEMLYGLRPDPKPKSEQPPKKRTAMNTSNSAPRPGTEDETVRVFLDGEVVKETDKAVAVDPDEGAEVVWLPKSQLHDSLRLGDQTTVLVLPLWLAKDKGLEWEHDWT